MCNQQWRWQVSEHRVAVIQPWVYESRYQWCNHFTPKILLYWAQMTEMVAALADKNLTTDFGRKLDQPPLEFGVFGNCMPLMLSPSCWDLETSSVMDCSLHTKSTQWHHSILNQLKRTWLLELAMLINSNYNKAAINCNQWKSVYLDFSLKTTENISLSINYSWIEINWIARIFLRQISQHVAWKLIWILPNPPTHLKKQNFSFTLNSG